MPEGLHLFDGVGFFGLLKEFCDVGFEPAFAIVLSPLMLLWKATLELNQPKRICSPLHSRSANRLHNKYNNNFDKSKMILIGYFCDVV